MNVKKKKMMD